MSSVSPQQKEQNGSNDPQERAQIMSAHLLNVLHLSTTLAAGGNPFFPFAVSTPPQAGGLAPQAPMASEAKPTNDPKADTTSSAAAIAQLIHHHQPTALKTNVTLPTNHTPAPMATHATNPVHSESEKAPAHAKVSAAHHHPMALTAPKLATPPLAPFILPSSVAALSVQDIAKEAMRITKESMRKQQQQQQAVSELNDKASKPPPTPKPAPQQPVATPTPTPPSPSTSSQPSPTTTTTTSLRLNKFVRRLHDMIKAEKDKGVVEWRRGLLVLHSTAVFAKNILPKFFNTRNFKTFRRQLNYYGFVHVRSFSNTAAATTTALWVHQDLAATLHNLAKQPHSRDDSGGTSSDPDDLGHILRLRRVEPSEDHKTVEGRRQRKEMALYTVEEDLQVSTKSLQRQQIQSLLNMSNGYALPQERTTPDGPPTCGSPLPPPAVLPQVAPLPAASVSADAVMVPLVISVPQQSKEPPRPDCPVAAPSSTLLEHNQHEEPPKKKLKQADGAAAVSTAAAKAPATTTRPVSDGSVTSVAVVSEPDEEELAPTVGKPPKTECSAANLLLLLSQAGGGKE